MPALSRLAQAYLRRFADEEESRRTQAALWQQYVSHMLEAGTYELHAVSARAKGIPSARIKILMKGYGHPYIQLTDAIGVRVMTYFAEDVDRVAGDLRQMLEVDESRSSDKRMSLGLREFGYRSVHLLAHARENTLPLEFSGLDGVVVEIQVRSILEHAWAEIEHEIVYKSGVEYPDSIRRRFSAIAGAMELVEREFAALRKAKSELIEEYRRLYAGELDFDARLDAPRLVALFEVLRSDGSGWRAGGDQGEVSIAAGSEATCVAALRRAGYTTANEVRAGLADGQLVLSNYAALRGQVPSEISHLAIAVLLVAASDREIAEAFFPDMLVAGSEITQALDLDE